VQRTRKLESRAEARRGSWGVAGNDETVVRRAIPGSTATDAPNHDVTITRLTRAAGKLEGAQSTDYWTLL